MTIKYKWSPSVEEAMTNTLDSFRREYENSAISAAERQMLDSAAAYLATRPLENLAVESLRHYLESIQVQKVDFDIPEVRFRVPVVDALRGFEAQYAELRSHIEQSIAPLPDLLAWQRSLTAGFNELGRDIIDSVNQAVGHASLLWSTSLPAPEPHSQEPSDEPPPVPPSERLLQVVPAEALTRLKSVDLVPFRVLDRIYQGPKAVFQLTPRQFEQLVAEILKELGFQGIELTPRSGDKGRDVVAVQTVNGIPIVFAFECKRHAPHRKVGVGVVRTLLGTVNQTSTRADVGVLVTTSTFTRGAQNFFLTEARIKGRDFNGIVEWLEYIKRLRRDA